MARHRQRARERKLQQPHRENVPGELEHASAEVDEVEASIIAGAGGEPAGLDDDELSELDAFGRPADEAAGVDDVDELVAAEEDREDAADGRPAARRRRAARDGSVARAGHPPARRQRAGVAGFLRASWSELQRVQWPDRKQVGQATAVVLGFVALAGAYLGIADTLAQKLVNLII
jgi:preprotein translocase subunit SecE